MEFLRKVKRFLRFTPAKNRMMRRVIFRILYGRFSQAFSKRAKRVREEIYLELAESAKKKISENFLNNIKNYFGSIPPREFVEELALPAQIAVKKSELNYGHGYLLYAALRKYILDNPSRAPYTILETGTGRGFSSVMMAKALDDVGTCGKIITLDVLPVDEAMYWNCIDDFGGKKNRFELLKKWDGLLEKYIVFLRGYSDFVFYGLGLLRIHFAFIDGSHEYEDVKVDAEFVRQRQQKGDVIIFDDYTPHQFPGVVKVVNVLQENRQYECKIFESDVPRGYAYCVCRDEAK